MSINKYSMCNNDDNVMKAISKMTYENIINISSNDNVIIMKKRKW